jgi:uridylate kinase
MMSTPVHRRILLKLSGEALLGQADYGIHPEVLERMTAEIREAVELGVEVALVVGGGNIYRGAALAAAGMDRVVGDHIGMLATVMNALALGDTLRRVGVPARVLSAVPMGPVCESYSPRAARGHLQAGEVVLLAAGTGNPFFTTDTAASLRAIEIQAEILFKATKVDGVYSADPAKHPDAVHYARLSYDEVLERRLGVMDLTAVVLCRDHGLPLRIFNMNRPGEIRRAVLGEPVGSLVE